MRVNASGGTPQHYKNESSGKKQFGIFVGKVKDNVDKSGLGRLRVWIPQLSSAQEDDEEGWFTMRYCPPFAGATDTRKESTARDAESFPETNQSYGFWMVPPTKDIHVICSFINGDATQGVWWACLPHDGHTHALPAVASGSTHDGQIKPVAERNRYNTADPQVENRPEHPQSFRLSLQGLDKDLRRGHTNAGPFRNKDLHPGLAYGLLTPGQHSFMLDDGEDGVSGQIRLRTFTGHQIVMHEEGGFIHIINAKGTAWIEIDEEGNIDFYAGGNFSVHAENNINLRAGNNINFDAANNVNGVGRNDVRLEACQEFNITGVNGVNITSNLNMDINTANSLKQTAARIDLNGPVAKVATMPEEHSLIVNQFVGRSVSARVPEHEPWAGHGKITGGEEISTPVGVEDPSLGIPDITPAPESYEEAKPETPEEQALAEDCLPTVDMENISMSPDGFDLLMGRLSYRGIMYADGTGYSAGYGTRVDIYGGGSSKLDSNLKTALTSGPSEVEARLIVRQIIDRHVTPGVRSSLKQSIGDKNICLTQAVFDSLCIAAYFDASSAMAMSNLVVQSASTSGDGKPLPADIAKIWANSGYRDNSDQKNADAQFALSGSAPSSYTPKTPEKSLKEGIAADQNAVLNDRAENPAYPWSGSYGEGVKPQTSQQSAQALENLTLTKPPETLSPEEAGKITLKRRQVAQTESTPEPLSPSEAADIRLRRRSASVESAGTMDPAEAAKITLQRRQVSQASTGVDTMPPSEAADIRLRRRPAAIDAMDPAEAAKITLQRRNT